MLLYDFIAFKVGYVWCQAFDTRNILIKCVLNVYQPWKHSVRDTVSASQTWLYITIFVMQICKLYYH